MSLRANILLVDDNAANLLALEATLDSLGQRLVRARSGEEAARIALEEDFAVILLDVEMPGMDGHETAALLKSRERSRHTPLIFLTANDMTASGLSFAYKSGAVDFLVKPFDPVILRSKVSVFVELFLRGEEIKDKDISRKKAEALADHLSRIHALTSSLAEALTSKQIADVVVDHGLQALGADTCSLYALADEGGTLELIGHHGIAESVVKAIGRIDIDDDLPSAMALRKLESVFVETPEEYAAQFPALWARAESGELRTRAFWCAPLVMHGRAIGLLGIGFFKAHTFGDEDRSFITTVARQCGQALERARLYDAERRANDRLQLIAEASRVLSSTLDFQETLENFTRFLVPLVCDWCAVDMPEVGDVPKLATYAHADDAKTALVRELRESYPPRATDTEGVMNVLRTGVSELYSEVTDSTLRAVANDDRELALRRGLGFASAMLVPLRGRAGILGVLTLVSTREGHRFGASDLVLAEELAARAGLAVDNARLHREAQDAIHFRDEFLSIASHELNTPLTPLKLQLGTLRRHTHTPEKTAAKLEIAERQVDRLTNLVRQLLDVSRITAGRLELEREHFDLRAVVQDVTARLEEQLARSGARVAITPGPPVLGFWDRLRMDQIATNLVSNAVKYGDGKPVEVEVSTRAGIARLAVSDHGIGIAADHQARIFGRFERAVSSRNFGGFGLGLWIVRQIVEASGGTIAVASTPGLGSTFTVELPTGVSNSESAA